MARKAKAPAFKMKSSPAKAGGLQEFFQGLGTSLQGAGDKLETWKKGRKEKGIDMDELRDKQARSSKGASEFEHRKLRPDMDFSDLRGTEDKDPINLEIELGGPVETSEGGGARVSKDLMAGIDFRDVLGLKYEDDPEELITPLSKKRSGYKMKNQNSPAKNYKKGYYGA